MDVIVLCLLQREAERRAVVLVLFGHLALARFGGPQRLFDFRQACEVFGDRGFELLLCGLDLRTRLCLQHGVAFRGFVVLALGIRQLLFERRGSCLVTGPRFGIRVVVGELRAQPRDFSGMRSGPLFFACGGFDDGALEATVLGDVAERNQYGRLGVGRNRMRRRVQLERVREAAQARELDFGRSAIARCDA